MAIYLDMNHSKGLSSVQLAEDIGVTQRMAWHMLQRIRHAVGDDENTPLCGTIEADETFLGGEERNKHESRKLRQGRGAVGKQPMLRLRERGGKVVAKPIPSTGRDNIHPPISASVETGSRIYSGELRGYEGLPYATANVRHGAGEYVRGNVHTNDIEPFWAIVKRCYVGTHHWWSHKHTARYVDPCAFRQNNAVEAQHGRGECLVRQWLTCTMLYKTLVGAPA